MIEGVSVGLQELIALRRYAQNGLGKPKRSALFSGNHISRLRGRGMDFSEVRNYQAGDEIRHMEWRVTARTGRPHVKLYQEERERPVIILTDFNPSMYFGTRVAFKSVVAAKLAAVIAWSAIKQGDRVGGVLFSPERQEEFTPRSRETAVLPLLAALSNYTQSTGNGLSPKPLEEVLMRLRHVTRPGSLLVIISDFYTLNAEGEKQLGRLRAHNDVLAYQVCDPLELSPPKPACYGMSNGKESFLLDTRNVQVRREYQAWCDNRTQTLRDQLKRVQTPCVQVTAEANLPLLVRETFTRRACV
ncbi:MAG: DUF58 domain-containing protein [Tatlockia sp.]|jgi:uncharacterized protein (DUF58 family)